MKKTCHGESYLFATAVDKPWLATAVKDSSPPTSRSSPLTITESWSHSGYSDVHHWMRSPPALQNGDICDLAWQELHCKSKKEVPEAEFLDLGE